MSVHIVRLGSPRAQREGLRLGTVRRPPRGVPRTEFARMDWYDLWMPDLAPSVDLLRGVKATPATGVSALEWARFARRFRREMAAPATSRLLDLLAAQSAHTDFSVGCYCHQEILCHRSILRELLEERGAVMAPAVSRRGVG